VEIDRRNNVLIVGEEEETYSQGLEAEDLNFISGRAPLEPQEVMIKIRYRSPLVPATLYPPETSPQKGEGSVTAALRIRVVFDRKQKAVTPGQSVVFYRGDEVLGGGIIASRL
jgi:tRNA-specific 2-thiouridylase